MRHTKEEIREALVIANKRMSVVQIAEAIKLSTAQYLYEFLSGGVLGKEKLTKLEEWLVDNGYLADTDAMKPQNSSNPVDAMSIIVRDLRVLLDTFESGEFSNDFKLAKLGAFAAFYAAEEKRLRMDIKKGHD